jgi:RimJ/RimL family protein N-acetyltransferase
MQGEPLLIRRARKEDFAAIYPIFQRVVSRGDTYAYDPNTSREEAYRVWMEQPRETYVAIRQGQIVGTYYIKSNQPGQGSHVCNCGYMVSPDAWGGGIATRMCEHSLRRARELGYLAMQFNLVVSTNTRAVSLWQHLGFEIVGQLPKAFRHPDFGLVDAYVMYQEL